jgi:hypothetical protein
MNSIEMCNAWMIALLILIMWFLGDILNGSEEMVVSCGNLHDICGFVSIMTQSRTRHTTIGDMYQK